MTYPNIRFGYKQPGNLFIARRAWWRIPVVYQTAQQIREYQAGVVGGPASVNLYPSVPANYVLSVYEIPSQLPISGNANLQIGLNADNTAWGSGVTITGSIYGSQIQLAGGTNSYNGVSSRQQVNVLNPTPPTRFPIRPPATSPTTFTGDTARLNVEIDNAYPGGTSWVVVYPGIASATPPSSAKEVPNSRMTAPTTDSAQQHFRRLWRQPPLRWFPVPSRSTAR